MSYKQIVAMYLALETGPYESEWATPAFINSIRKDLYNSPYTPLEQPLGGMHINSAPPEGAVAVNDLYHIYPENLSELAVRIRRFQTLGPFDYAAMLATAQGVKVTHADASAKELARNAGEMSRLSFRDVKMVTRLGETAITMEVQDPVDPPRLAFVAGAGHEPGVTQLLQNLEVPFTGHEMNPDHRQQTKAETIQSALNAVVPFVDSPLRAYEKRWIANAQSAKAQK